jgi:hypothetical protein
MLVAITILISARQRRARLAAAILATLIATAELLWWNVAFRLNAESRTLYAVLEQPTGAEAAAILLLETALAEDHARGDHPRVEVVGLGGPWQNLAMVRGWEAINGYNPLRIGFYDRLVAPGEENWNIAQRRFPPSFDSYDCALARALGLTYLVLGQPLEHMAGMATPPEADLLLAGPPVWIYRLKGAMPRVSLSSGDARIVLSRSDRVEIVANAARGGLLTLHDIYYPGWIAEIDGKPAPILRTDILFRGVELSAGRHQVIFRFAPLSPGNLGDALNAALAGPSTGH